MQKIIIQLTDAGSRLDKFLIGKTSGSRSEIQKKIKAGEITVGGKTVAPHFFLRAGNIIEIQKSDPSQPPLPNKEGAGVVTAKNIEIIHEDPDYLVVCKPAGLLVHADAKEKEITLADILAKKYPEIKKVGEPGRPGIVHRLDKDVSGLLIVARTQKGYEFFKKAFESRDIKKEYTALVYGEMPDDAGDITFKIGRSKSGRMAARPESAEGREALTKYDVVKKFGGYTLLKIQIITGRTHQIRVHLKALGCPVVGDTLYGKHLGRFKKIDLNRVFLHAGTLGFTDPSGTPQEFHKDLPEELEKILDNLKS